ncbi:hypothetical protein FRC03_007455, partial [Tulasnella sp. 419]
QTDRHIFPHVFVDRVDEWDFEEGDTARSMTEQRMSLLSYALRSKTSWWTKYKDPNITSKWRSEALEQTVLDGKLNEAEVDYVIDELGGYERLRDEATGAEVSCFDRIWQSDTLIPPDLRDQLITEIKKLEDIPEEKKDWHPRSDGLVLDIVHPSLYCLVYGRTRGYPTNSDPKARSAQDFKIIEGPDYIDTGEGLPCDYTLSKKFAWIPTDFHIAESGDHAEAKGYINNLHPSHTDLYKGIEILIARFSHLFDRVLTDLHPSNPLPVRTPGDFYYEDDDRWPDQEEGEDDDTYDVRVDEWKKNRPIVLPTVPAGGYNGTLQDRKVRYTIRGRDLQVIVKVANIHLSPEKPEYKGGSWHVEGMANEFIVASGIYYYSSENVTTNQLAFRESVIFKGNYEQDDSDGVRRAWGLIRYIARAIPRRKCANKVLKGIKPAVRTWVL